MLFDGPPPPNRSVSIRRDDSVILRYADKAPDGELVVDEDGVGRIARDLRASEADVLRKTKEKKNYRTIAGVSTATLLLVLLANFGLTIATVLLTRQFDARGGNLVDRSSGRMVRTQSPGDLVCVACQFQGEGEGGRRLDEECPRQVLVSRSTAAEDFRDYLRGIALLYWQEDGGKTWGGTVMPGALKTQLGSCDTYVNVRVDNFPNEVVSITCCDDEDWCCVSPFDSDSAERRLLETCVGAKGTVG